MKEFALSCGHEHPSHSMILDTSDKTWNRYFTASEIDEIKTFNAKKLVDLPPSLAECIVSKRQYTDSGPLKTRLSEELDCSACEWVRITVLDYIKLFKFNHLPLTHQTGSDMLRRIWPFVDTVFDGSNINCIGGEKSSRASSAGRNVDSLYTRQRL